MGTTLLLLLWVATQIPTDQLVESDTLEITNKEIAIWQAISKQMQGGLRIPKE